MSREFSRWKRPSPRGRLALAVGGLLLMVGLAACGGQDTTSGGQAITAPSYTPPPLSNPVAAHTRLVVAGVGGIKPTQAGTPAYSVDDMKRYVQAQPPIGPEPKGAAPTIVQAGFLTCGDIVSAIYAPLGDVLSGCAQGTHYGFVLESGSFIFAGPGGGPHTTAQRAFLIFDLTTGNLLIYGSADLRPPTPPTVTPGSNQPTPTTPPPDKTPSTTPTPHVALTLRPTKAEQTCQDSGTKLSASTLTLDNTGSNVAITWVASITDRIGNSGTIWASASPAYGSIPAGGTAHLTITPASNICTLSQSVVPDATYHVIIHATNATTLTFSDLVHSPIPG